MWWFAGLSPRWRRDLPIVDAIVIPSAASSEYRCCCVWTLVEEFLLQRGLDQDPAEQVDVPVMGCISRGLDWLLQGRRDG